MTRAKTSTVPTSSAGQAFFSGGADLSVIRLRGEHDIATVPALEATLSQAVAAGGADLVVDLHEVEFMDASTIGVIVGARNLLALQSRALTVRSPSVCARRVLDACGLTDLLDPSPAAAGATPVIGASGALGTWVAVAATARATRRDDAESGTYRGANVPIVPSPAADSGRRDTETHVTADHGVR